MVTYPYEWNIFKRDVEQFTLNQSVSYWTLIYLIQEMAKYVEALNYEINMWSHLYGIEQLLLLYFRKIICLSGIFCSSRGPFSELSMAMSAEQR